MARINKNDTFLDFDAIGGWKVLTDTIKREMPEEFTRLVLDMGDLDPDDAYSSVAYERGFNLLYTLEQKVGSPALKNSSRRTLPNLHPRRSRPRNYEHSSMSTSKATPV